MSPPRTVTTAAALSRRRHRENLRRLQGAERPVADVIEPGEMRAIIGPNGAGKTTMMDIITGKTRPDTGDVLFDGKVDLTKLDEAAIAESRHRPQVPEADGLREPRSGTI
jgi:ABC-type lipoprotein export system ATPase subunit